jgi:nitronate monooxygenase
MAGACPPALSAAVIRAGGMGACGALVLDAERIAAWMDAVRRDIDGPVQMNLWIPEPAPERDESAEASQRAFLARFGPEPAAETGDFRLLDFDDQVEALIAARPTVASSIMGLFPPRVVKRLHGAGIRWWATATTVGEALAAAQAGADAIVAQGMEAGGHRGAFDSATAERDLVGLFALVPAIADAVDLPVIAAGAVADGRAVAAALTLGASAVEVGTGFLRAPETAVAAPWADAISNASPEGTMITRALTGRPARALATRFVRAAAEPGAPPPAPYPVQRGITAPMKTAAGRERDVERMQAWAGQGASRAVAAPAGEIATRLWQDAEARLSSP